MSEPRTRLRIDVDERTYGALEQVMAALGATTYVEVIRRSLLLTASLLHHQQRGYRLLLRDPSGQEQEVVIL